jgi:cytochrome c biogenesis protein CcmG/thiol:disulfide interchange protein DsbE
VPETFVIDKDGFVRYKHIGPISGDDWTKKLLPLIQQLS